MAKKCSSYVELKGCERNRSRIMLPLRDLNKMLVYGGERRAHEEVDLDVQTNCASHERTF